MSGSGFRKGAFHDIFMLGEVCLRRFAEQQLISEGSDLPSLLSPPLHLNLFLHCFANILQAVPHEVVRTVELLW